MSGENSNQPERLLNVAGPFVYAVMIGLTIVNTLGATLYGIMIVDYYPLRKQKLIVNDLYSTNPEASYAYIEGWNRRAVIAFIVGAAFSVATVWVDALSILSGYAWLLGRPAWWRHLLCNGGVIE